MVRQALTNAMLAALQSKRSTIAFLGLFLLKRTSLSLLHGGELHFEHIEKFVEDADLESDLVLVLKKNRVRR